MDSAEEPGNYNQYRFSFYLNANHGIYIDSVMGDVHPHTWQISIHAVKCEDSFVMFSDVEREVENYLSQYQNKLFNDFKPFDIINPTLENIAVYLLENMQAILNAIGWYIFNIEVSESPSRSYVISLL
jgi:6-pyruvoyltetrahydropterin/6-carboxytetrahydropterin synthase